MLKRPLGHGRDEGSRKDVACQHGEDHRFCQRHEEISRDPDEEEHGHEHNADAKRRNHCRQRYFPCAVEHGLLDPLAQGHLAMDVLNFHRGIVHQDPDDQDQTAQGHQIDRLAKCSEQENGIQGR
jgi:hypothetical protein